MHYQAVTFYTTSYFEQQSDYGSTFTQPRKRYIGSFTRQRFIRNNRDTKSKVKYRECSVSIVKAKEETATCISKVGSKGSRTMLRWWGESHEGVASRIRPLKTKKRYNKKYIMCQSLVKSMVFFLCLTRRPPLRPRMRIW